MVKQEGVKYYKGGMILFRKLLQKEKERRMKVLKLLRRWCYPINICDEKAPSSEFDGRWGELGGGFEGTIKRPMLVCERYESALVLQLGSVYYHISLVG